MHAPWPTCTVLSCYCSTDSTDAAISSVKRLYPPLHPHATPLLHKTAMQPPAPPARPAPLAHARQTMGWRPDCRQPSSCPPVHCTGTAAAAPVVRTLTADTRAAGVRVGAQGLSSAPGPGSLQVQHGPACATRHAATVGPTWGSPAPTCATIDPAAVPPGGPSDGRRRRRCVATCMGERVHLSNGDGSSYRTGAGQPASCGGHGGAGCGACVRAPSVAPSFRCHGLQSDYSTTCGWGACVHGHKCYCGIRS